MQAAPPLSPQGRFCGKDAIVGVAQAVGAVFGGEQGAVEIDEAGLLRGQNHRRDGERGRDHASDHEGEAHFFCACLAMRNASVRPPALSNLTFTASYCPTRAARERQSWALSSAQTGRGRSMFRNRSSRPAGRGCSTITTPNRAQAARFSCKFSGVQPSLASTISLASGAACHIAARRSASPAVPKSPPSTSPPTTKRPTRLIGRF